MKISNHEKRDWSLLVFVVPVGIFLMLIAGQIAIYIFPNWRVAAEMRSRLNLETAPQQQGQIIQPILPDILTPLSWFDTFLTPNANSNDNLIFPPFIVFEASTTPSPASTATQATVTATATQSSPTSTSVPTGTAKPSSTPQPGLCKDPAADNTGDPLPCKYPPPPPPAVCTDSTANNVGSPLPCTYTPVSSPLMGTSASVPGNINTGAPDGSLGAIADGNYIVINLSLTPIIVNGPSDTNYDFIYFEEPSGNGIQMDKVILSISSNGSTYYVVFNWGDGIPDTNSNVGDVTSSTGTENDNQPIDNPVDTGELYGTSPLDTGILIDVDNAPSHPPVGSYQYLAIQAPAAPASTDGIGMDSVQVTEVPSPWP